MPVEDICEKIIPELKHCHVINVTLTGGEPFIHPDIIEIVRSLKNAGIRVGICTNGTVISQQYMEKLVEIGGIHVNVSLDGFSPKSHGRFRGDESSFFKTIETIQQLGRHHLLQGLLVTPNTLASVEEYADICRFALQNGATYVLINPLSPMGRGIMTQERLGAPTQMMTAIRKITSSFSSNINITYVRFPNAQNLPLTSCNAGDIIYVFADGDVAICAYLVFAARSPKSLHKPKEFIVGNIFQDSDIKEKLDSYKFHQRYRLGDNPTCRICSLNPQCGKGCPAAVISSGKRMGETDEEVCPISGLCGGDNIVCS